MEESFLDSKSNKIFFSIGKYDLPDFSIFDSEKPDDFIIWQPDTFYVVLGRGNQPETALNFENIISDRVKILKRPSGGETVVLSPKMLVVAVKISIRENEKIKSIFEPVNKIIIQTLLEFGVENLSIRGISDICIGNKKILGSSAYRKPDRIFYHAVLNISEDIAVFEKYLKHPVREPEYRVGRSHKEFVTSLFAENNFIDTQQLYDALFQNFKLL